MSHELVCECVRVTHKFVTHWVPCVDLTQVCCVKSTHDTQCVTNSCVRVCATHNLWLMRWRSVPWPSLWHTWYSMCHELVWRSEPWPSLWHTGHHEWSGVQWGTWRCNVASFMILALSCVLSTYHPAVTPTTKHLVTLKNPSSRWGLVKHLVLL